MLLLVCLTKATVLHSISLVCQWNVFIEFVHSALRQLTVILDFLFMMQMLVSTFSVDALECDYSSVSGKESVENASKNGNTVQQSVPVMGFKKGSVVLWQRYQ